MIIKITGKQGEGKSSLVNDLINIRNEGYLWTNQSNLMRDIRLLTEDLEFLVIDEVRYPLSPEIKAMITQGKVRIRRPYSREIEEIKLPHIVLISNDIEF